MRFHAFHGVLEQERHVGNNYVVDIEIETNLEKAIHSDNLTDTVNYASVYMLTKTEMQIHSDLLEHVAHRIAQSVCTHHPQIEHICVSIRKENPPIGGDCIAASVVLHFENTH